MHDRLPRQINLRKATGYRGENAGGLHQQHDKADVCGRADLGILYTLSTGSVCGQPFYASTNFRDADGWGQYNYYYGSIRIADVDGDGKADICGRAAQGTYCALGYGNGYFAPFRLWTTPPGRATQPVGTSSVLDDHHVGRHQERWQRVIAVFLLAGGLLGLIGSLLAVYHSVRQHQLLTEISCILSTGLVAWCIPAGAALWRLTPNGFKWAKFLFAVQVPVFSIARISYEFFTFFSFRVMIGNTTHHIGGNIGSSGDLNLLPQPAGFLFGINIIAVLVFLYLIRASQTIP
jgi:hypothetical protein